MNALLLAYLGALLAPGRNPGHDRSMEAWVADMLHEDSSVRDDVSAYLVRMGPSAIPYLTDLLAHTDIEVRAWAGRTMLAMGDAATDAIESRLAAGTDERLELELSRLLRRALAKKRHTAGDR